MATMSAILTPPQQEENTTYHNVLTGLMVAIFVVYGSLGRDIFFNRLANEDIHDPIGAYIGYFRYVVFLVTVLTLLTRNYLVDILNRPPKTFVPFLALAMLSTVWSENKIPTFRNSLFLFILFFCIPNIVEEVKLWRLSRTVLRTIAVVLILSFLLAVVVPSVGRHQFADAVQGAHAGRWRGIFGHKNGLGPWAAFGSVLFFTHGQYLDWNKAILWVARFCAVACLVFSGSATSALGAITLGLTWIFLRRDNVFLMSGALVGILMLVLAIIFDSSVLFDLLGRDETLTGRTVLWEFALSYASVAPFIGHGYMSLGGNTFLAVVENLFKQAIPGPENGYLALLLELGFLGVFLFFAPVFVGVSRALRIRHYTDERDRALIEMMIMIVFAAMLMCVTESTPFIATGFDGVICFTALFVLLGVSKKHMEAAYQNEQARSGLPRHGTAATASHQIGPVIN